MGDMGEDFRAMQAGKQARHAEWKQMNMAVLSDSGAIFTVTNSGETLLFRMTGYPRVDFYPSTGRWRVAGVKKTFRGGAQSFLNWYAKQKVEAQ
jgi:hypothetical protein